jgi:hypothetical protein
VSADLAKAKARRIFADQQARKLEELRFRNGAARRQDARNGDGAAFGADRPPSALLGHSHVLGTGSTAAEVRG